MIPTLLMALKMQPYLPLGLQKKMLATLAAGE